MRQSAKVFGFLVASALLVAACGGDDSSTTDTARVDSATADSATSDTTADDGDRERNVQVGGWGVDGSGTASVTVRDEAYTNVSTKVFRRARTEDVNEVKVVNTREIFVTTMVQRTIGATNTTRFTVQGFSTDGDDPTKYPMANFGTDGVVTVDVPVKEDKWGASPISWTMVSRDVLAAYYANYEDEPTDGGVIEYYDMRTGGLLDTLGEGGRTVLPVSFPVRWVTDFGLRTVDEDGTVRLMIAGTTEDADGNMGVRVAGITSDGELDARVGDDGSGVVNLDNLLPATDIYNFNEVRIVDPGLDGGASGAGVLVLASDPKTGDENGRNAAMVIKHLFAGIDRATGKVSLGAPGSFESLWVPDQANLDVRSAVVTDRGAIALHVVGSAVGESMWNSEQLSSFVLASAGKTDAGSEPMPRWADDGAGPRATNLPIIDQSPTGIPFAAGAFRDPDEGTFESRVCFDLPRCYNASSVLSVGLTTPVPFENYWSNISSLVVDESGAHLVVRHSNLDIEKILFTAASFDFSGKAMGNAAATFDPSFESSRVTETSETEVVIEEEIGRPVASGAERVVALHYQPARTTLRVQKVGAEAEDMALRLPLGISSWVADAAMVKPMSSRHVSMAADVDNGETRVRRVYKVDVDNGSIDTAFGTDGYVETFVPVTNDECGLVSEITPSGGAVSMVAKSWTLVDTPEGPQCSDRFTNIKWSTFDATGKTVGNPEATVDPAIVEGTWDSGTTVDSRGNLYVAKSYEIENEKGQYIGEGIRIGRITQAGALDTTFAKQGILELPSTYDVKLATDAEGRLYVAMIQNAGTLSVRRFTAAGALDVSVEVPTTTTTVAAQPAAGTAAAEALTETRARFEDERGRPTESAAALPAGTGLTVTSDKPVLSSVKAEEDRSLTVAWAMSAAVGNVYVTATANPGGRSCTSDNGTCIIRGLDPTETYTITLAKKGDEPQAATVATATKPVVSLRVGRVASPTVFVRPASKGKATWKVRGGCKLNETNTRLTAPKSPTTCQLSVTTAKSGSTPKTTKSVTIVVKK